MRLEGQNTRVTSRSLARSLTATRRFRGDRGAILAEAALITPLFIFILFGILEFGGSFRDYLTLNNGVTTGARKASIAANAPDADFQILTTARKEINAMPLSQVEQVIIFHATRPRARCRSDASADHRPREPVLRTTPTRATSTPVRSSGRSWRRTSAVPAGISIWGGVQRLASSRPGSVRPPDYIGVYIKIRHKFYTGLFGSDQTDDEDLDHPDRASDTWDDGLMRPSTARSDVATPSSRCRGDAAHWSQSSPSSCPSSSRSCSGSSSSA